MRIRSLLLLSCLPLCGWGAITDQPPQSGIASTYDNLQSVCRTLLQTGPVGNIDRLSPFYHASTNTEIREAITAATGLFWMMCQQIANAERFSDTLRKNFPNSKYQFLLDKEANLVACTNCHGGIAKVPCPDCGGTGKCRNCDGRGKVAGIVSGNATLGLGASPDMRTFAPAGTVGAGHAAVGGGLTPSTIASQGSAVRRLDEPQTQQPCPLCGGSGACKTCKGTKLVPGRCPFCQGFGSVFTPRTRIAYVDVLDHLRNLARAAGMAERNMVLLDGHWTNRDASAQILLQRIAEHADFARMTADAERAKDYDSALQTLDRALARHPDSIYTADVRRLQAMLRADAADKHLPEKSVRGPEQMTAAKDNPRREIGIIVEAVLDASRRGTNAPLLIAEHAMPPLPAKPLAWRIGEPELIDRTARVRVQVDRPSRSGFPISEPWEFLLLYDNIQWKIWQAAGPQPQP